MVSLALVVLLIGLAYLVGVPLAASGQISRTDATPGGTRPADIPGHLFVLAGSDQRDNLTAEEQKQLGTGSDPGKRSDVLMLLYVPTSGKAALISVPRDSYVTIPGHGKNKINAAYSLGGPKLLVGTVEQATGLRVDGYAEVGFSGFVDVVDAVGGVQMCPKAAIRDVDSNLNIPGGCQNFDGPTALGYARMRHADPLGDLGRVQRQRELLSAIAKTVVTPATVLLPTRYWGVSSAAAKSLTLGKDDGPDDLTALAVGAAKIGTNDGIAFTVPIKDPNLHTPAGSAVSWDAAQAGEVFASIARGDTASLAKYAK